jgi:metallophosphoesterase superfamily enzyme
MTKKETKFLKENWLKLSNDELAKGLGWGLTKLRQKARELGLPSKQNLPKEKVEFIEEEEKPKFTVIEGIVTWNYKHGSVELPLESLDQIFYEYSIHGLNLSQVKIQNKHGLTAIQWQSLKRTFDLVKDSDVFSPYTLSLHTGKEQCDMIAKKIEEKYNPKNMREVIAYEDGKQRRLAYDKAIKTAHGLDYRRQEFESELLEYVSKATEKVVTLKTKDIKISHGVTTIADLHVGANIEETETLQTFNAQIVKERLNQVANEINERKAGANTICFNGDLIETFTGLNHPNSWKNVDSKYGYGVKATIMAVEIITEFLQKVHNIHEVLFVAGNHDRTTSSNKEDVDGEVIQWVHYVINAKFGHLFNCDWNSKIIARNINNVGYIWTHGHHALSKRNPAELVTQYGFGKGIYSIIIEGHLHTRKIKADTSEYRSIVTSSIFTGNDYSDNSGWSTLPGFTYMYSKDNVPYPVVLDIPLL